MKDMRAYFTVEAALIVPLVISILSMTVFLFIFQYDRCLAEQDAGMMALYAGTLPTEDSDEIQRQIGIRAAQRYTDNYVLWTEEKMDIFVGNGRAEVTEAGYLSIPVPEWNFLGAETGWKMQVTRKISKLSPVEFIRLCRKAERSE